MRFSDPTAPMLAVRDRYFVPIVLAPFAEDLARRLTRLPHGPVLEIVADTGVLTQMMAACLSAGVAIVATDPDPAALEHAAAKLGMTRVTWQVAEPHALPFRPATFGAVTCLFAASLLPDRVAVFRAVRRVLKPGGRFVFTVPGHLRQNPVAECIQAALQTSFPPSSEAVPDFLSGLHGYGDSETIDDDLTQAGYTDAIYTAVDLRFAAASAQDAAMAYCAGTPLKHQIEHRLGTAIDIVARAVEKRFGAGPIQSTMRAHVVSAAG
jgi:SAM-dependent methyltransferase